MNIAQNWRLNSQRYTLEVAYNENGAVTFPPRPIVENRVSEHYDFELEVQYETVEVPNTQLLEPQRVA